MSFDVIALAEFLLNMFRDCPTEGRSRSVAAVAAIRQDRPIRTLAIWAGLRRQGLRGHALRAAMEEAKEFIASRSDQDLYAICAAEYGDPGEALKGWEQGEVELRAAAPENLEAVKPEDISQVIEGITAALRVIEDARETLKTLFPRLFS